MIKKAVVFLIMLLVCNMSFAEDYIKSSVSAYQLTPILDGIYRKKSEAVGETRSILWGEYLTDHVEPITATVVTMNTVIAGDIHGNIHGNLVTGITVSADTVSGTTIKGAIFSVADGTLANPSIRFTNDPDLGFYRDGANTMRVGCGGTEMAYWSPNYVTFDRGNSTLIIDRVSGGWVGFGVAPARVFHINEIYNAVQIGNAWADANAINVGNDGTDEFARFRFIISGDSMGFYVGAHGSTASGLGAGGVIYTYSDHAIIFGQNNTEVGRIDADGYWNLKTRVIIQTDKLIICDDYTDTGINAAIDALGTEGGEVYLPEGLYVIDGEITIDYDNTTLRGAGAGTILQVPANDDNADRKIINITSMNDCVLTNFTIDGNKDNNTGEYRGVYISAGSGHKLSDLWIENIQGTTGGAGGDGIYCENAPTGISITNVTVKNVDDDGMDVNDIAESEITGCTIDTCGDNGIDTDHADHLTIIGNSLDACSGHGIELEEETSGRTLYCTVSGNSIKNTTGNSIHIASGAYCSVTGNVILYTAASTNGIYLGNGTGLAADKAEYNVITGNMIKGSNSTDTGINEVSGEADYNLIMGNDVTNCATEYTINGTNTRAVYEGSSNEFTFNQNIIDSGLTASKPIFTDASKKLVSTGTLAIDQGGTGQTAQTAAFDALSPLTTKGDVIVHNGSDNIRLAVGADTQVLTADSAQASGVKWAAGGGGGVTTFVALTDTPAAYTGGAGKYAKVNAGETALEFDTPAGAGDVVGPGSSTDNAIARFHLTTGKIIQNSGVTIDDSNNIVTSGNITSANVYADVGKIEDMSVGDLRMENDWTFTEHEEYGVILVSPSGKRYKFLLEEVK